MLLTNKNKNIFVNTYSLFYFSLQRDELLRGDFSNNIKILQNYPSNVDIQLILSKARKIRQK